MHSWATYTLIVLCFGVGFYINNINLAPECWPTDQRITGSIPRRGHVPRLQVRTPVPVRQEPEGTNLSTPPLPSTLSNKIKKIIIINLKKIFLINRNLILSSYEIYHLKMDMCLNRPQGPPWVLSSHFENGCLSETCTGATGGCARLLIAVLLVTGKLDPTQRRESAGEWIHDLWFVPTTENILPQWKESPFSPCLHLGSLCINRVLAFWPCSSFGRCRLQC